MSEYIIVGKVGKTHGIKGWIKIHSFTSPTENLLHYCPWFLQYKGQWQQAEVETKKSGDSILAKFTGIDTPEAAKALTNKEIAIERSQLPELENDEIYWHDLIGLDVSNLQQQYLGKVDHLFSTGANDVLVVKHDTQQHLIPYVLDHHIIDINMEDKQIVVDWDLEF